MTALSRRRTLVVSFLTAPTLAVMGVPWLATAAQAAPATGVVYLVQGVADSPMTITLDGQAVATSAAAKTIVGPLDLAPGDHAVTATGGSNSDAVSSTINVAEGGNSDVVLHRQVDPSKPPVFTTFANDLSPVAAGSGRLTVAHTAAVGPADVRVDQKVLFSNIASGEALTVVAPAGAHTVDIVPTATTGPVVFGPAQLPVTDTALTRVFAIGVAATGSMDAVVQVLPVSARGAGTAPSSVNAGDGGQAAGLIADAHGGSDGSGLAVVAALSALSAAVLLGRRRWLMARGDRVS